MNLLRIKIYQPNAHYRLPFTYQRRHTYPIPPYSTVIGFLINAIGFFNQSDEKFDQFKKIKISIAGRFESKITEYIWFRNLSKQKHEQKFGYAENRENNGHIEHIGGQSPMRIDVLNEMHLIIYLAHEDKNYINQLKNVLSNPKDRLEILHLGRAEDWIVFEEEPRLIEEENLKYERRDANYKYFFWIPKNFYIKNGNGWEKTNDEMFDNFEGLLYNLPTFATIEDYENTFNRHGKRHFEYVRTKLNDGLIKEEKILYDTETRLPIFLGELNGE
jgi:CRISPR-associated protein Cas5t